MVLEVFRKLDDLPTLPNVASALMRMGADENVQVEDITRLIEGDPSTAARLLKIVNSASQGLQRKVSSVGRAVVMLGVNGVRNVLLSMQVFSVFGEQAREKNSALFEIWKHCLAVASASELVAENTGGLLPEDAFTAGLLHDIGKIALYSAAPEEYQKVIEAVRESGTPISDAERAVFEVDHCEAGRYIAEKWALPEALVGAAYTHHLLPDVTDFSDQIALTSAVVAVADDLVRRQRIGFSGTPESWEPPEEIFALIGLDEKNIVDIRTHLVERISARSAILDVDIPEADIYLESLQKANSLLGNFNEDLRETRCDLERSQRRLQAVTDLNAALGSSFDCDRALAGMAEKVYEHLPAGKVVTYCVDERGQSVFGSVRNGSSTTKSFVISALKDSPNDVAGLGDDREILVHLVRELAGKLDEGTGLATLIAGRLLYVPRSVGNGQRAGILVETSESHRVFQEDLQFLGEAAGLFLERAILESRLRSESEKLIISNRKSRGFYEQLLGTRKLAAIGRMAAGAAHEINNPLAIVSGRVQLLLKMEAEEPKKRHLDMIRSQCDRMSRIISDILTFAKPEKPVLAAVSPPEVVDSAIAQVADRALAKDVHFTRDFPAHLAQIAGDFPKIEQAFRNILANAIDASETAGEITIAAALAEKDRFLAVTFADKGKGMGRETLNNIFEPFFTTKEGSGIGLGLSICHSIIASHGGKVRVKSTPGQGTVFTLLLPVWKGL